MSLRVLKEGMLEKRSSSIFHLKRWYIRHFKLTDDELSYTHPDKPNKRKKSFEMQSLILVKLSPKHYLEIEVLFAKRKLRLRALSRQDKIEWVAALKPKFSFSIRHPTPIPQNSMTLEDYVRRLPVSRNIKLQNLLNKRLNPLILAIRKWKIHRVQI